jgi:hypothetical protein
MIALLFTATVRDIGDINDVFETPDVFHRTSVEYEE